MKNQQKRNKNKVKKNQNEWGGGHLNSKWKTQGTKIIITF